MNYTKEQILTKAKKVIKDLQKQYFIEDNIDRIWFEEKNEESKVMGKTLPVWIVSIIEPIFDSIEFCFCPVCFAFSISAFNVLAKFFLLFFQLG